MLQRVEQVAGTVFDPVFVAGDDAARGLAVIQVLPALVAIAAIGVHPLDNERGDTRLGAEPDR